MFWLGLLCVLLYLQAISKRKQFKKIRCAARIREELPAIIQPFTMWEASSSTRGTTITIHFRMKGS
ncbi:hypothetical protein QDY71_01130 [Kingella negevensis]|uniref:hypothetical protein n=1 Tax=Kingella negevensis TaxID=1522312 RepID=UPI00254BB5AD|nr:hypothetical protein [Kingella negevensis]MDK4696396.1 hypothetical protein [Kingella negevensis]